MPKKTNLRRGGVRRVRPLAVRRLPKSGTIEVYRKILKIPQNTLWTWINHYDAPAKRIRGQTYDHYLIEKEPFVKWLTDTGRLKKKSKYD